MTAHTFSAKFCAPCDAEFPLGSSRCHRTRDGAYPDDLDFERKRKAARELARNAPQTDPYGGDARSAA